MNAQIARGEFWNYFDEYVKANGNKFFVYFRNLFIAAHLKKHILTQSIVYFTHFNPPRHRNANN